MKNREKNHFECPRFLLKMVNCADLEFLARNKIWEMVMEHNFRIFSRFWPLMWPGWASLPHLLSLKFRYSEKVSKFETNLPVYLKLYLLKGQLISKANYQAMNSSKKRMFEFVFMRRVFVGFLEEIEDTKKTFRN